MNSTSCPRLTSPDTAPPDGCTSVQQQPVACWRENCRGAPVERAPGVEGTRGAWGVREKPPRGGQERKIRESSRRGNLRRRERQGEAFAAIERAGGKSEPVGVPVPVPAGTLSGSFFGTAEGRERCTARCTLYREVHCGGRPTAAGNADRSVHFRRPRTDGAAKRAPVTAEEIGNVITDRTTTVIDDPVRVRDGHDRGDGTGDGRIGVAVRDGAKHRAVGAEVEDEAAAAAGETRSVEVVARRFGSGREKWPRRADDAALLSMIRLTRRGPSSRGCPRSRPGRRGWR